MAGWGVDSRAEGEVLGGRVGWRIMPMPSLLAEPSRPIARRPVGRGWVVIVVVSERV